MSKSGLLQNNSRDNLPYVKVVIALVGALFLLVMGLGMFRSTKQDQVSLSKYAHSPIMAGVLLSLGNPYFLVWWATVGAALILRSVSFGLLGFMSFAFLHWLCDFVWSYFLSALSFKGGSSLGRDSKRSSSQCVERSSSFSAEDLLLMA